MSSGGMHCNGDVKPLLTYSRKRARSSTPVTPGEDVIDLIGDASASDASKVSSQPLPKENDRYISWDHAVRVNENRFRWKCNWCGLVRAGGIRRLKEHLADGNCSNVPENIARIMRKHLSPAVLRGLDMMQHGSPELDNFIDKEHTPVDLALPKNSAAPQATDHSCKKQLRIESQRSKVDKAEDIKENPDAVMHMNFIAHDGLERVGNHWRNILEQMLQFPDISEGTGVHSCIHNALILGPSCFSRKANTINTPEDVAEPNDRYGNHHGIQSHTQRPLSSLGATSDMSKTRTRGKVIMNDNTMKCQNVFFKMLCSDKFALLCDLICGSLLENKALGMVDFGLINSKMTNGDYEVSPELFDQDIQQVWEKVKKIGKDIFHLGSSLSNLSLASFQKQVGEDLVYEAGEQKFEDTCEVGVEQRNSTGSTMTTLFPCNESDRSTKLQQTEASCLYEVFTCKKCGTEADGQHRLICDGCEAIYHFSCVEPAVQEVPTHSWYCSACMTNWKGSSQPTANCMETAEPLFIDDDIQQDRLHENCVVCDRLDVSNTQERPNEIRSASVAKDSRESSVSSIESDEPPEPSRTAMLHLCKLCGACEDDDKRFLICGHTQCPYKYYHIRCLKTGQIASLQQKNRPCWYCPSCLCRGCFSDTDDDKIVLCDACDEGYHIYCMTPPCTSIPKGQWYCISCNIARAREGMRSYEQLILQRHGKDVAQATQVNRSVDILLSAAEKLNSEERLTTRRKDK